MSQQHQYYSNAGDAQRSTEGPSAAEWEAKKPIIRNLYEKKRLKEVKVILEHEHNFKATYVDNAHRLPSPILMLNLPFAICMS